jgi:hypothetical protein
MRQIEYLDLLAIRDNPDNPKRHETGGIGQSMTRFGLIDVAVRDDRTGMLVAGHGRIRSLREAQEAGGPAPDGVTVTDDGQWLVPVVTGWSSWDDAEALATGIALNTYVERGDWDLPKLADILDRQRDGGGLAGLGYEDRDLVDFRRQIAAGTEVAWQADLKGNGTARAEKSLEEQAASYRHADVRTLVLDYPLAEYLEVIRLAGEARARHQIPGNAELFAALLRGWVKANPEV